MTFKRILFILYTILNLLSFRSTGQAQSLIPNEFVETVPPTVGSTEWLSLNHSKNEFCVKIIDDKLQVKKANYNRKCELAISGGKVVGVDNGEFGGTLFFESSDTTKASIHIKSGNVKFIFSFKNKIYFIEGLAHIGIGYGALYELSNKNNIFTYNKLIDFEDAPRAYTIYHEKILIACTNSFYIVNNFKKELIFKNTFWDCLYPNSIAVLDYKNVFIGIRSGIIKLNLTNKSLKFYKYIKSSN